MKLFKENKILFVVLLAYAHGIMPMQTPVQSPEKPPRKPLTQAERELRQAEYKLRSDQQRNVKCAEAVRPILKRARDEGCDALADNELTKFSKDFNFMKDTPLKTQKKIADEIVDASLGDIDSENNDPVIKNNEILDALRLSSAKKTKIMSIAANILSSPEIKERAVVDADHVMQITAIYSADGKKLIRIIGGHCFEAYLDQKFIKEGDLLLIASDGKTIGFNFSDTINKTLYLGLSKSVVVDNLKYSDTIAKSLGGLKIGLVGNDRYVGSYQDSNIKYIYSTIFPLFVVNEENKNEFGDIYIGAFARLNSETVNENDSLDLYGQQDLFISSSDFNKAMNKGIKFESEFEHLVFAEVTDELNIIFAQDLVNLGLSAFPVSIYGIVDNREIK